MKRRNSILKTITSAGFIAILLLGFVLITPPEVEAINSSGSLSVIQPKNVYDIGDEINLHLVIYSDKFFDVEGQFFADGSTIQAGSIADFRPATGLFYGINASNGWDFVIRVKMTSAGTKTFRFTATCSSKDPNELTATSQASASVSVRVRTAEERQQAEAAWAAEQERLRQEAAKQASIEASIAESRAIEASIEASIDQSIKESSWEEEVIRNSIEESIRESESEVERTRPSEIGEETYARLVLPGSDDENPAAFYFLLKGYEKSVPPGFEEEEFYVNENEILAFRREGMDNDTFLVYGMFEGETRPAYYYYHATTCEFFAYSYLDSEWKEGKETEESEESSETEETEETSSIPEKGNGVSSGDPLNLNLLIPVAGGSLLLGAAIASVIALAAGKKKKKEKGTAKKAETKADPLGVIEFEEIDDFGGKNQGANEIDDGE